MILWDMNSDHRTLTGVPSGDRGDQLEGALVHAGANPVKARAALRAAGADPLELRLVKGGKRAPETGRQMISDILLHGITEILSARGKALAMRLGGAEDDFWPCRFDTNPDEAFFLVLPNRTFDIVDAEQSTFLNFVPTEPPVPAEIGILRFNRPPHDLPPLFRTRIPKTKLFFCGLLVRDDFKAAWEQSKFTGATFRRLC